MEKQRFEQSNERIQQEFRQAVRENRLSLDVSPPLSWSIWMFGRESLTLSVDRLKRAGVDYVELAGNHHTRELGANPREVNRILSDAGLEVSGVCGLYSPEVDLASDDSFRAQAALDYTRRELEYVHEVGGKYLIVVPSAVGRTQPEGSEELPRSAERLARLGEEFDSAGIKAAVEAIRADEVSLIHTIGQACSYIETVNHPAIQHINGDVYHMLYGERHVGEAILEAGHRLANLHLADTNRGALGTGMMDVDTILRSFYLAGGVSTGAFCTAEPLGAGRDPYSALTTTVDPQFADRLVNDTVGYLLERWEAVKADALA